VCHVVDRPAGESGATGFVQSWRLLLGKGLDNLVATLDRPSYRDARCSLRKKSPGSFGRRSVRQAGGIGHHSEVPSRESV